MKALVVDVQRERRRQLCAVLLSLDPNIEIIEVASGEEAGLFFTRQPVDLLVTSARLAGISGAELARRLRQRLPGIKVILLGSVADETRIDEAAREHADELLTWPVASEDFSAAVRRCLQGRDALPSLSQERHDKSATPQQPSLNQRLEALCLELDARACALLDGRGQVQALAGSLPHNMLQETFIVSATGALQAAAGVSAALGAQTLSGVLWIAASRLDVFLTAVNSQSWLLVACAAPPAGNKTGQPARDVSRIQRAALALADQVTVPLTRNSKRPEPSTGQKGENVSAQSSSPDLKLEKLFNRGGRKRVKTQELNAFWDNPPEETDGSREANAGSDGISYEEARRRGLTPSDE